MALGRAATSTSSTAATRPTLELTTLTEYRDGLALPGRLPAAGARDDARRGPRRARRAPAPRRRDREVRARHLLLQRRPRGRVGGGGARAGRLPARRRRPTTDKPRDERRRGGRGVRRALGGAATTASGSSTSPTPTWSATPAASRRRSSAIEAVDACLGEVVAAVHESGGACIVTADHGNAEQMLEPDGSPNTAHSTQPGAAHRHRRRASSSAEGGVLADVAPTVLALLGIEQPEEMTGPRRWPCRLTARVRDDPDRLSFEIDARDGAARTGRLLTPHGAGRDAGVHPAGDPWRRAHADFGDVAGLGYELVLGNTFHLFLAPGAERIARARRPARVHGLGAGDHHRLRRLPGLLARPRQRRRRDQGPPRRRRSPPAACSRSPSAGSRFRSYIDGSERFIGPEESMGVQAALGSDIALVFDECTPFHADRDYTARSTERTHRWLDRCLDGTTSTGPRDQAVFGIVQGGVHEDLRRESAEAVSGGRRSTGSRSAAPWAATSPRCTGCSTMTAPMLPAEAPEAPARDRRARRPARRDRASASTSSTARCRPGSRATAWRWRRCPSARFRFDVRRARQFAVDEGPLVEGCPCPTCARPHPRLPALPHPRRAADRRRGC